MSRISERIRETVDRVNNLKICGKPNSTRVFVHTAVAFALFAASNFAIVSSYFSTGKPPKVLAALLPIAVVGLYLGLAYWLAKSRRS
jgi:hypothetical protein